MKLEKRLVETFKEMKDNEDAECYTVTISYEDGQEMEFTFTAEELEHISYVDMESYFRNLIDGEYH
ncbi:MAG: hypothetical protein KJO86_00240 [Muriicola sp.]|nr:hypothetical protein [Muriicola sp.]